MFDFSLIDFGMMINDTVRMRAYAEALKRTVHPDSVVVDIGTGTGIFALLACQYGARKVYALDPNPWIDLGKKMAAANGFADRIEFIRDISTSVTLPEQADVIISEIRGRQPLVPFNIPTIQDARKRLLKPGGAVIPTRDIVYVSLISAPAVYRKRLINPWEHNQHDLDLTTALPFARNTFQTINDRDVTEPLFPPQVWVDIDYRTREDTKAEAHIEWIADAPSTAHYIMMWFDTLLADDIGFTTAPWAEEHATLYAYDALILQAPLEIAPGDKITLDLGANVVGGQYVFTWDTTLKASEGAGSTKASYRQSSFLGSIPTDLRSQLAAARPHLNPQGQITYAILRAMNKGQSAEAIAAQLCADFPKDFKDASDVLPLITELAQRYHR